MIEILVVAAIISVIAGLVSSVTVVAVRSAKDSKCSSNLLQLDMAAEMYATANDSY